LTCFLLSFGWSAPRDQAGFSPDAGVQTPREFFARGATIVCWRIKASSHLPIGLVAAVGGWLEECRHGRLSPWPVLRASQLDAPVLDVTHQEKGGFIERKQARWMKVLDERA
jgi:hypothetical protein